MPKKGSSKAAGGGGKASSSPRSDVIMLMWDHGNPSAEMLSFLSAVNSGDDSPKVLIELDRSPAEQVIANSSRLSAMEGRIRPSDFRNLKAARVDFFAKLSEIPDIESVGDPGLSFDDDRRREALMVVAVKRSLRENPEQPVIFIVGPLHAKRISDAIREHNPRCFVLKGDHNMSRLTASFPDLEIDIFKSVRDATKGYKTAVKLDGRKQKSAAASVTSEKQTAELEDPAMELRVRRGGISTGAEREVMLVEEETESRREETETPSTSCCPKSIVSCFKAVARFCGFGR